MKKWLIGALVLLVLLPLAGTLLVRYLLSPTMLKQTIERQGSAWLGHPVTVGSAQARVLPTAGIELTDVAVAGPVAVDVDHVVVRASVAALLARRVEDAVVRVSGGRITLADVDADEPAGGESDMPPAPREAEPQEDGGFAIVSVREIVLEDVTIAARGQELRVDLEGSLEGDRVEIRRMTARSGRTSLDASGVISSLERREGDLRLTSPLIDVNEVLALVGAFLPARPGAADAPAAAGPSVGRITVAVRVDRGRVLHYEVENLETTAVIAGSTVTADPLEFDLYGGRYTSALTLSLAELTSFSHRGRLQGASVEQLASLFGHGDAATGTLGFQMNVEGRGPDFARAAEGATGRADVRLIDGTIAQLDVVRSTFSLLGASPPERGEGERYDQIAARLDVSDGWLRADEFVLESADFDMVGQVAVDPAGRLEGSVDLVLSEALSKEAQSTNRDLKLTFQDGRITLPASIGGTLTSPRVLPDLEAALTRAARNRLESEVDKAKEKAGDEIRKRLEGIIPRPRQ